MKKLLFSLLFSLPVMAQDGFRNEDGNLLWQHSYPATDNLQDILDSNPDLQVASFINDVYTGSAEKIKNSCEQGSVAMRNNCTFDFEVRRDNNNCVVTVSNLRIIEVMGPMQARTLANRCEKYFVDASHKIKKDQRTQNDIKCVDSFLTGIFGGAETNTALTAN